MEIYQPAEDSYLLSGALKKYVSKLLNNNSNLKVLDVGGGSGILAETLIKLKINPQNIILVDINPEAIKHLKKNFPNSKVIKSNLFAKVKGKFDLVVFNPPYLPNNKFDKERDTSGGKNGDETILRFLKKLEKHLDKNGKCFLLTSALTPMQKIEKEFKNFKSKLIARKKLFYEELFVWEISLLSK